MSEVTIGVDIGQGRNPTAICVAEAKLRESRDRWSVHFLIRHLQRLPLGTTYPQISSRLAALARGVEEVSHHYPQIFVNATGLGEPVVDLLREDLSWVTPVYFTHGDRRSEDGCTDRPWITLGKAYLVSRLQALLQRNRLHLPKTPESEALARELLDYETQVDEKANDRYGAFPVGAQDDLVTALGLAVQKNPIFDSEEPLDLPASLASPLANFSELVARFY